MLSQTGGTVGAITDLGNYTDAKHYRLPEPAGARVVYNLLTLAAGGSHQVLAFTSCRRFSGTFRLRPGAIEVVLDLEGLTLGPGETWPLEEFAFSRRQRSRGAARVGGRGGSAQHHQPLRLRGAAVGLVLVVLLRPEGHGEAGARQPRRDRARHSRPALHPDRRRLSAGDGRLARDRQRLWRQVQTVLKQIRDRGFEPAIWVAPFIAEAGLATSSSSIPTGSSRTMTGQPLRADRVTFGGWRRGPWYALDGTHPEAQAHLERVFTTMRNEWGCTYFKLDANFWGAIHGGRFHDPRATRIEAYRRGMAAVLRGTPRRVHPRLQPSDLAVDRRHPRLAQLARHPARLEALQRHRAAEPEPQLAERPLVVERSRRDRAHRRAQRGRVSAFTPR